MKIDKMTKTDWVRMSLTNNIERANDVRTALIADLQKGNSDAVYQLRWLQGKDQDLQLGALSSQILKEMDKPLIEETDKRWTVGDALAWVNAQIDSWTPESSSSPYSSEMNNVRFKALKDLRRSLASAA